MEFSAISHWILFTAIGGLGVLTFGPLLHTRFSANRLYQLGLYGVGALALVASWYIFFWLMTALAGRLAPWDMWPDLAPPAGDWQRQLNDFFSQTPNANLPAIVAVGISVAVFIIGVFRVADHGQWAMFPVVFAATNLAFVAIEFLIILLVADHLPDLWLPQPRPSVDMGYHRTWPSLLITVVLLVLLYWQQGRIVIRYGAKRDTSVAST